MFAHPAGRAGAEDTLDSEHGVGAGRDATSGERSWQRESERGQPVRLHASRIPLCISVDKITELFAQYGQLVDGLEVGCCLLHVRMHVFECAVLRILRPDRVRMLTPRQMRPMKSSRGGHCSRPLGWCIVKYADYTAASRCAVPFSAA